MSTRARGIPANGPKIQELRRKLGKTQKGLLANATVELRTYQRAEKGEAILPELLEQIAKLLKVELKDIRADKSAPAEVQNGYRLHNAYAIGAVALLRELQRGYFGSVDYDFDINPGAVLAAKIAAFIEYCRSFQREGHMDQALRPEEFIRATGALNDMIRELASRGVRVFFGQYTTWHLGVARRPIPAERTGKDAVSPALPDATVHLRVVFSSATSDFIADTFSSFETYESAVTRSIKKNIQLGIHPDWLDPDPFVFDDEYITAYRKAYLTQSPKMLGNVQK